MWSRGEELRVESAASAERFIEDVAFANMLTDARRAGPSFDIAVCGWLCDFGCGDPLIWAARFDDFQRAAKQRSALRPRTRLCEPWVNVAINFVWSRGAATIGQLFST